MVPMSNEERFEFGSDRAITELDQDRLDRRSFVESLATILVRPDGMSATGITVGLVGRWGEGKSSILQLLRRDLLDRYKDCVVVDFSPWLVSQRHDLLRTFFDDLARGIGDRFETWIHRRRRSQLSEELSSALGDYVERVAPAFELVHPGGSQAAKLTAFAMKKLSKIYRNRRADEEKLTALKCRVETLLSELSVPVIILIDEVDRIDDGDVRELMHLVRAVADFPTISYVLAYDEERVSEALGFEAPFPRDRMVRGRKYLEKIVQVPVQLPIIFDAELDKLLIEDVHRVLASRNISIPKPIDARFAELRKLLVGSHLATTRDVRRVAASFAHRMTLIAGEVEWVDVLGLIVLGMSAPELFGRIRKAPEEFVFDGGLSVHINRTSFDQRFKELTEARERASHNQALFGFLFPAISGARGHADCLMDEVAFRRPLITFLRMKALSTAVTRAEVLEIIDMPRTERRAAIRSIVGSGRAIPFAERLADLIRRGEIRSNVEVWVGMLQSADELKFETWNIFLDRMVVIRDLPDVLISLILTDSLPDGEVKEIVERLVETDAFEITTILVRKLRMRLQRGTQEFGPVAARQGFDIEWLSAAGISILERARGRTNGGLLPVALVYLAADLRKWSPGDREHYSVVLSSVDDAFDRFVMESFGGYYSTDAAVIDEAFMPLPDFRSRLEQRKPHIDAEGSVEIKEAYAKASEFFGEPLQKV
jgi:hypothetical protein